MQNVFTIFVFLCLASLGWARLYPTSFNVFDVVDYGAVGDGVADDTDVRFLFDGIEPLAQWRGLWPSTLSSEAFLQAWNTTCKTAGSSSKLTIPQGKFFNLNSVSLEGPCSAPNINIQILGGIVRSNGKSSASDHWIKIDHVDGLTIEGPGQIDGQGSEWWTCKNCDAPDALGISNSNNVNLQGFKIINSPKKHIGIDGCNAVHISQLTITAPGDSPNTDGIHLQDAQHVVIDNSTIATGDDCISIGRGSCDVNISQITCGPGHGISIGSLGNEETPDIVQQIHVSHCSFINTKNGARVKTWQGGKGYAKGITFENLNMNSVDHPIVIDQYYCNGGDDCQKKTGAVEVSDVSFISVNGTTTRDDPISLKCSESVPCTGILLQDVLLKPTRSGSQLSSTCINVHGIEDDPVFPKVSCLNSGLQGT
ncbi:putative polygalacturonase At3g15720 [Tasmannia lanceolata]|uniref:putative polygalacturonase At3g15720 n=1 Tax=Tasmannia lanceolata TaxID=3420 RepID=UPI00406280FB